MSAKFDPMPHPEAEIHPAMGRAFQRSEPEQDATPTEDIDLEDPEVQCWCGAKGKASQLFDGSGPGCPDCEG